MSKTIIPVTIRRTYGETQSVPLGDNKVLMAAADDDQNQLIDIWFEVEPNVDQTPRNFIVEKAYSHTPKGYEHVASTLSNTGDSYHIYREVEQKPKPDSREVQLAGLSREMDYGFSIFKAPSKSPFATGATSEEGVYELLSRHSNYGTMGKAQLIHQLRQYGRLQVDDQEINNRTYFMVFHKLRPTDGM